LTPSLTRRGGEKRESISFGLGKKRTQRGKPSLSGFCGNGEGEEDAIAYMWRKKGGRTLETGFRKRLSKKKEVAMPSAEGRKKKGEETLIEHLPKWESSRYSKKEPTKREGGDIYLPGGKKRRGNRHLTPAPKEGKRNILLCRSGRKERNLGRKKGSAPRSFLREGGEGRKTKRNCPLIPHRGKERGKVR